MNARYKDLFAEGLWRNNPGLVQLLGLCPLLAVSNSVVNALGLGLATLFTLLLSNGLVSLTRRWLLQEIRIPAFVLIIASTVTVLELLMHAFFHELYGILGIFIPLIVTNCTIMARAEAFASRNALLPALADGLATGLGFLAVLLVLGGLRELLGHGTLLADAHLLFGEGVDLTLHLLPGYRGFLLAVLPMGAFMGLGLLVALHRWLDRRWQQRQQARNIALEVRNA